MSAAEPTPTLPPLTRDAALALYDSLPTVNIDFMLGAWRGEGFATGHPLDGVLETCHWHGKRFHSADHVDPLVFRGLGGRLWRLNPAVMPVGLMGSVALPANAVLGRLFQLAMPLMQTRRSRARLRMIEFRGKTSAAMLYDDQPINDVFRKLDDNRVLGIMDLKGMGEPFFFQLERESQ
jgi:hypothetical protein